jgi:hypothetical protein
MSPERGKFVDLCLSGDALVDEIDDYVDQWHESNDNIPLYEFLGFAPEEYSLWVERPDAIKFILFARAQHRPLEEYEAVSKSYRIAARAESSEDVEAVIEWLKQTGRLPA